MVISKTRARTPPHVRHAAHPKTHRSQQSSPPRPLPSSGIVPSARVFPVLQFCRSLRSLGQEPFIHTIALRPAPPSSPLRKEDSCATLARQRTQRASQPAVWRSCELITDPGHEEVPADHEKNASGRQRMPAGASDPEDDPEDSESGSVELLCFGCLIAGSVALRQARSRRSEFRSACLFACSCRRFPGGVCSALPVCATMRACISPRVIVDLPTHH